MGVVSNALGIADRMVKNGECDHVEIWIKRGRYWATGVNNKDHYSFLPSEVTLRGGFAGTETSADEADPVANRTYLNGDRGNDSVWRPNGDSTRDVRVWIDESTVREPNPDGADKYWTLYRGNSGYDVSYGFRYLGVYQYSKYSETEVPGVSGPNAPVARDKDGNVILDENNMTKPMMYFPGSVSYQFRGGDAIYEDVNSDGQINELDIVYLGSSLPKFTGGFGFKLSYGRLSWNNQFNFRYGNKIINQSRRNVEKMYNNNNQSRAVNWRWRVEGDITSIPRALYNEGYNALPSDRFVEDGSFIRLNYSQISYSFEQKVIKKWGLNQLSLYVSANNLFCLTKYSGSDPEVNYSGISGTATDNAQTPRAKSFTAGVTIQF